MPDKTIAQQTNIRAATKNIPLSVLIELTHACNLNCYYCYRKVHRAHDEFSPEEWLDILHQLSNAGTLYITFSGGEPFARQDLLEIIAHARDLDFAVSIITNGTAVTTPTAEVLSALGVMDVGISLLAADAALHDELCGVTGSLSRSIDGLRSLVAAGVKVLIKHTVSNKNFGEYLRLRELADREECLFECDSIVVPAEPGAVSPFALTEEQQLTFLKEMGATPLPCIDREERSSNLHCDAGRSLCGISPSGEVFPCIQLPIVLGNLREHTFTDIWHGTAAQDFRENEKHLHKECTGCDLRSQCSRCHGIALLETGDWRGASPGLCSRARAMGHLQEQ